MSRSQKLAQRIKREWQMNKEVTVEKNSNIMPKWMWWTFLGILIIAVIVTAIYDDYVGKYYRFTNYPIVSMEGNFNPHSGYYEIYSEHYKIRCKIKEAVSFEQVCDTTFTVWDIRGDCKACNVRSSILKKYFKENVFGKVKTK